MIDWQRIVRRHGPLVWKTACKLLGNHADAADCFQETFLSAVRITQHQHVKSFPALLRRLATARAIDQLRRRFRNSRLCTNVDISNVAANNPQPEQNLQTRQLVENLRKALSHVPQQQAEVFCLRHLNNMSYRRIAEQLGLKTSAVGVLLHRARANLRPYFEPQQNERGKKRHEEKPK